MAEELWQSYSNCGKSRPMNRQGSHTTTATRVAQKKQFTESLRSRKLASGAHAPTIFTPDTVIGGVFKIVSSIGMGGMGVVYLAEHTTLCRLFALKVLTPELLNEQSWLRFQAEAKTMASLNHKTFVKVYDLGIHASSVPFYSMDYLKGRSLEEILVDDGPLPLKQTLDIFLEVLDGLAYAHRHGIIRHGIIHRDLKPGNIMLCTTDGAVVKILDFGIAKLINSNASIQSLTADGDIFGSPHYMSPEQCSGEMVDARSDIYSIGCALFEVLTGFVPYEGANSVETVIMHQEQEPPCLADVMPNCQFPPSLDLVLAKCLAKLPQARYQSAKELELDLARIREGKDVLAYSNKFPLRIKAVKSKNDLPSQKQRLGLIMTLLALGTTILSITIFGSTYWLAAHRSIDRQNHLASNDHPRSKPEYTEANVTKVTLTEPDDLFMGGLSHQFDAFAENKKEPTGSQNETVKYSTIQTIEGQQYRCFKLPEDVLIGVFYSITGNRKAEGQLKYPQNCLLFFKPTNIVAKYPQYLKRFQPGDIHGVQIYFKACSDKILDATSNIPGVKELNFRNCQNFTPKCISALNKFKSLQSFHIYSSCLSGDILARATCWQHLQTLRWNAAIRPTALLKKLQSCPNLQMLELTNSSLSKIDYELIAKLSNLKILILNRNQISVEDVEMLSKLPLLNCLDVRNSGLGTDAIPALKKFSSLRELKIGSSNTYARMRTTLKKELPNIHIY